jgi:hypothetical protein
MDAKRLLTIKNLDKIVGTIMADGKLQIYEIDTSPEHYYFHIRSLYNFDTYTILLARLMFNNKVYFERDMSQTNISKLPMNGFPIEDFAHIELAKIKLASELPNAWYNKRPYPDPLTTKYKQI